MSTELSFSALSVRQWVKKHKLLNSDLSYIVLGHTIIVQGSKTKALRPSF